MAHLAESHFQSSLRVYPIGCYVISAIGSAFCFYYFYFHGTVSMGVSEIPLLDAVLTVQFQLAVYLSIAIAVPMGVDLVTDTVNVLQKIDIALFHWFVRSSLLICLTLPSILLAIPSIFHGHEDSGYLAVNTMKKVNSVGCLLALISYEKSVDIWSMKSKYDASGERLRAIWRGRLTLSLHLTYVTAELLWFYGYCYQHSMIATYTLKVAATTLLSVSYLQLLHLLYFCENLSFKYLCTLCRKLLLLSKRINISHDSSYENLMNDTPISDSISNHAQNSKRIACVRIYFAALIIQPIGYFLISSVYGNMDFLNPTSESLSSDLYFQMAWTMLVSCKQLHIR